MKKKFVKNLLEKIFLKSILFEKPFLQKNIFQKKICKKKFKNIYFSKKIGKKLIFQKQICEKIFWIKFCKFFFLPTLIEVSSSGLKFEENEIFLLQWVEVG